MVNILPVSEKSTKYVDIFDLALFLSRQIGMTVQIGEKSNGFNCSAVVKESVLNGYDRYLVNEFLENGCLNVDTNIFVVLRHAVNEGWIDPGHYIVQVKW